MLLNPGVILLLLLTLRNLRLAKSFLLSPTLSEPYRPADELGVILEMDQTDAVLHKVFSVLI